jgi:hypothetical protein
MNSVCGSANRMFGLLLGQLELSAAVGAALYEASEKWARERGENEFAFIDRAMTLYAGALHKLDPDAARTYLHSLAERLDSETSSAERRRADQLRIGAFERLRTALAGGCRAGGEHPMSQFKIEFIDAERETQNAAEPAAWPENVSLIENPDADAHCATPLKLAPRCGVWSVTCSKCGKITVITVYGRAGDPRAIAIACDRRPADA